jgi:tetratricopeptide (TPR) repeat protein
MEEILGVRMWEEEIEIPTYSVGKPDKNPMFLEKRVYQGSSGKVYPYPVIDKIYDEKNNQKYKAVFLENKYLMIMILPELGGRIQRALDKTNNYDFVYYNQVIKPALVGLAGPWISGGIEFNWPQHHRPNTFGPVEYLLKENQDGSKTLWVSEIDKMFGTKGMAGFTLYCDKGYLEITGQLYNRTAQAQTFLWWANPAVAVNENTQSVFPPDVHAVFDHGKRDVSTFPIATGIYYKMDYSAGVDISRYKNVPVPTSYMAQHSNYDFIGGYDHSVKAGILHIANHHISPGKKQWTWGSGEFGKAWDRNLTDEDGPYIELMTGVFTDNQPDFTWLNPYEEKTFKQYFMPYKDIGMVKNATIKASVSLEVKDGKAYIGVYATQIYENAVITLQGTKMLYLHCQTYLSPNHTYVTEVVLSSQEQESDLLLLVVDKDGKELVSYQPAEKQEFSIPEAAKAISIEPKNLENNESLYLAGLHLEQYRHATYDPDPYYLEGLLRDPEDMRINNAYGSLMLRRGGFKESEKYFRQAIRTVTRHNLNPYDGEAYYNLGLSLSYQGKFLEAYDAFYKAVWSSAWQDSGYYSLAQIDCRNQEYTMALEHINKSIVRNYHNCKARFLKTVILRTLDQYENAIKLANETLEIDALDFGIRNELAMLFSGQEQYEKMTEILVELRRIMRDDPRNYITLSMDYASAGYFFEAANVLLRFVSYVTPVERVYPMIYYYLAYFYGRMDNEEEEASYCQLGMKSNPDYCFPNSLEDILILENIKQINPVDGKAYYYLGNLWYDKKQYEAAIGCWETSIKLDSSFPTTYRNLALAYYNKKHDLLKAQKALERAFHLQDKDARILLELDQLYKKINISCAQRLILLYNNMELVQQRDDLYIEYITLLNITGKYEEAKMLMAVRIFHPWEGGEGKLIKQYVYSHMEIGKQYLKNKRYMESIQELQQALVYTENLGEGKLLGTQENDSYYYLGCAYKGMGENDKAKEYFIKATIGLSEPINAVFYNDQPPEMIFYQGLALIKLGKVNQGRERFNKLIDYGEKHLCDQVAIDYFAVSLPDFLIFDEDLNKKNKIHCHYLMGLGYLGIGNIKTAEEEFKEVLQMDVSHQGAITHLNQVYFTE